MTRMRTETRVVAQPVNNIYTALTGAACVAVLIALILAFFKWGEMTDGQPLFFGLF